MVTCPDAPRHRPQSQLTFLKRPPALTSSTMGVTAMLPSAAKSAALNGGLRLQFGSVGEAAIGRGQDGVAVGVRTCGQRVTDQAAGAGLVVDHDGLSQRLAHAGADQPRDNVQISARGVGDDDRDGAGRVGRLREGRRREADAGQECECNGAAHDHERLLPCFFTLLLRGVPSGVQHRRSRAGALTRRLLPAKSCDTIPSSNCRSELP